VSRLLAQPVHVARDQYLIPPTALTYSKSRYLEFFLYSRCLGLSYFIVYRSGHVIVRPFADTSRNFADNTKYRYESIFLAGSQFFRLPGATSTPEGDHCDSKVNSLYGDPNIISIPATVLSSRRSQSEVPVLVRRPLSGPRRVSQVIPGANGQRGPNGEKVEP
jgi:hypothetical protein